MPLSSSPFRYVKRLTNAIVPTVGAWYAEFIFVYYRVFIAFVVAFFDEAEESVGTLVTMMVATTIVLAFVVVIKPYRASDDKDSDESKQLPNDHRMQVVALIATLVAFALGLVSLAIGPKDTDGRTVADAVISLLISLVVIAPMIYPCVCPRKSRTDDESDGNVTENPMADEVGFE
eukprot:SAG31_NODE_5302_length_2621_cov_2.300159_1_plen_176_part_00